MTQGDFPVLEQAVNTQKLTDLHSAISPEMGLDSEHQEYVRHLSTLNQPPAAQGPSEGLVSGPISPGNP